MSAPDISVVVPCYNHGTYLERLVNSVRCACSDGIAVQIVIVDDGSTDDSRRVASGLADRFPEVEVVTKKNGGLSGARNTGIARRADAAPAASERRSRYRSTLHVF
jgi:glycosyltransferase involved in cell wall biosynthesis